MPTPIRISIEGIELSGELSDTPGGRALAEKLPFNAEMNRWGEELYGPVSAAPESFEDDLQEVMDVGDLAFHQESAWFCIFWGPTPSSKGEEIRAAFPVHKVGTASGDWQALAEKTGTVTAYVEGA